MTMTNGILHGINSAAATASIDGTQSTPAPTEAAPLPALPQPMERLLLSDDAIHEIAALLASSSLSDRKDARVMRTAAEKTVTDQTAKRIAAMRDKADAVRQAAWVNGSTGMAAGLCSVYGGGAQLSEANSMQTGSNLTKQQENTNGQATQRGTAYGQLGSGSGQIIQGGGTLVAGEFQANADNYEADAVRHEALAGRAERAVTEHDQEMGDAMELFRKVTQFLQEVRASQNGATQAAVLRS